MDVKKFLVIPDGIWNKSFRITKQDNMVWHKILEGKHKAIQDFIFDYCENYIYKYECVKI